MRIVAVKFLQAVPVILIISILAFLLLSLLPGDPAVIIAGEQASPEAIEQVRRQLGLDRPFLEQLAIWLFIWRGAISARSLVLNQSVLSAMGERLPVTLSLAGLSILLHHAGRRRCWARSRPIIGGPGSIRGDDRGAAWACRSRLLDRHPRGDPVRVHLGWVPSSGFVPISQESGRGSLDRLPAAMLSLFQIGFLARMTRSAMLDVLSQDYIRTARSKGFSEWRTVGKHAFRNALILVDHRARHSRLSAAIGGSVVIEQVFALPGIGRLVVQAILARDYPLVQGVMLIYGFAFVMVNLTVDILYTFADPRVRYD